MIVVLDFDGTVVTHEYPKVGRSIGAEEVLRRMVQEGHKIVLFTMRSGDQLTDAVQWFADNRIELYGIQRNPTQDSWTTSPKAYGHLIIDDAALGAPLIRNGKDRPYIDWSEVEKYFFKNR